MEITDLNASIDALGSSFEEFKKTNDVKLGELEKRGTFDPLHEAKLEKINADLEKLQAVISRPDMRGETKDDAIQQERKALRDFLRGVETKALSSGSSVDGGFLVPTELGELFKARIKLISPMRENATVFQISTNSVEIPFVNGLEIGVEAVSELGSRSETSTPIFSNLTIQTHEMATSPIVSKTLLEDAAYDVEGMLIEEIAEAFAKFEASWFVTGNGAGRAQGFLSAVAPAEAAASATVETHSNTGYVSIKTGSATAISADNLIALQMLLKQDYIPNAKFFMNQATLSAIRQLKYADGTYIWQPSYQAGTPQTLLGSPVVFMHNMPNIATYANAVAFGDMSKAYAIADRLSIEILRDPYSRYPNIALKSHKRVGGAPLRFEPLKILQIAAQ
jgi:HK97 family phage major capsid protein